MSDRFARLKTDPRFRRPRKKEAKVVVDERFKSIFDDTGKKEKKGGSGKRVDKYGRAVSSTHEQDNLRRFYRMENEDEAEEPAAVVDYARGGVLLESSDEEEEQRDDDESDDGGLVVLGQDHTRPIAIPRDEEELEFDLDEDNFADLDAQAEAAQAAQHAEADAHANIAPTRRIAAVNLDWDHVRASHLHKIFSSLVSTAVPAPAAGRRSSENAGAAVRGRLLSVRVYPSQFGKERMAREEVEGPPAEVFRKTREATDEEEVDEKNVYDLGEEDEVDEDALRKYQISRLRYYYAVAEFDTVQAASHVFSELEGTELERSANVFDLSYVPDDMSFDEAPRDEATGDVLTSYKGLDFVTDALRHSKVKLTWDEDDPERNRITRRALSKKEIDEADFGALIASSGSESESELTAPTKTKKATKRDRLRSLLLGGGGGDELPEGWAGGFDEKTGEDDIDMEITFMPGLSEARDGDGDETTLEAYQRKMREKRKKRKEEVKESTKGTTEEEGGKAKGSAGKQAKSAPKDDFFASASEDEGASSKKTVGKSKPKAKQQNARMSPEPSQRVVSTADELALLAASDNVDGEPKHFDMKAVLKAEKKKGRKGRRKEKPADGEPDELQENFAIDVKDDRFQALHEDHAFAIDPSNPHFKKTKGMAALLDERTKRRKSNIRDHEDRPSQSNVAEGSDARSGRDLQKLVDSVKRKTNGHARDVREGKRRRI